MKNFCCEDFVALFSFKALPAIFQLFAQRLQRDIATNELRLMLLQVFVVILWLNPDRFFECLNTVAMNDTTTQPVLGNFFNLWMNECQSFVGIHDRRVCALGLCTLLRISSKYYSAISSVVPKILPNCIFIYQGLIKTYRRKERENFNERNDNDESGNNGEFYFYKSSFCVSKSIKDFATIHSTRTKSIKFDSSRSLIFIEGFLLHLKVFHLTIKQ